MSSEDDNRENKLSELSDKLDGFQELLEMEQEHIDRFVIELYYLSIHYKDCLEKKVAGVNEAYIKSKKLDIVNLKEEIRLLRKSRNSIMNSIDVINCKLAVTEMSEFDEC